MRQTTKTLVTLAAFLAVALGLSLYAWKGVYVKDADQKATQERTLRLFAPEAVGERAADGGAALAVFRSLTVTAKGETSVLERQDGGAWQLKSPVVAKADPFVLDGVVSQLQTAKFKAAVDPVPDAEALKGYGLSPPQFLIEARATVDGQERTVVLKGGLENSYNGTVFMQRGEDPTVWAAEGGVRFALNRSSYDLRDKEVLGFDEAKLSKVAVKTKTNAYVLERDAARAWQLKSPTEGPADATAVSGAFTSLKSERAQSFPLDTPAARAAAGLDAPAVDVQLTLEDGGTARLRLGRPSDDRAKVTALREGGGEAVLAEVPGNALAFFDRNPGDFDDRSAVHFETPKVAKIVVKTGAAEVVLQRAMEAGGDALWLVMGATPGQAKLFKVTALLWTLSTLKANGLGEKRPKDWGKYGLDAKAARKVSLYDVKGTLLSQLVLGNAVPDKQGSLYARGDREQVLEVDGARLSELPTNGEALLDLPESPDAGRP